MSTVRTFVAGFAVTASLLAACGEERADVAADAAGQSDIVQDRIDALGLAVNDWRTSRSIGEAHAAAEAAANLVVGPGGPGYGDRDGDGTIGGESGAGLLIGIGGEPAGLPALVANGNECVERDVLGGDWSDPDARWSEMSEAIDAWRSDNNTMPSLASHPMRIVGWATFSLATDDLDEAHEYGGHAQLHVDVSARAVNC